MARFRTKTISRRTVEALKVDRDTMFWDSELAGFGVRVYASGTKVYIVQTREPGKPAQRVTVGHHGEITAEEARRRAVHILLRIRAGEDPVPEPLAAKLAGGPTVGELATAYLKDHVAVRCRESTAEFYALVVNKYLIPRLGKMSAAAVDYAMVTELLHSLGDRPVMANKVVDTLSRIYNAAEDKGLIVEASNPFRQVVKFRERRRERFLTPDEFKRLGRALDEATTVRRLSVYTVAALRLLLLTGCRKREILDLRWERVDLDAGEFHLPETKTGTRTVALSPSAIQVLREIPREPGSPWVIPGKVEGKPMRNIDDSWEVICKLADLKDMRIHDCRHSFASRALALGVSLPMIGRLLGHSEAQTTERYAHLAGDWVRESAVRISDSIAADLLPGYSGGQNGGLPVAYGAIAHEDATIGAPVFPAPSWRRLTRSG